MHLPILHPFARELRGSERLRAFAEALPAAARPLLRALPMQWRRSMPRASSARAKFN